MGIINDIISQYALQNISDIHFHQDDKPYIRKHSYMTKLTEASDITREDFELFIAESNLRQDTLGRLQATGSCDFGVQMPQNNISLRLNLYFYGQHYGLAVRCLNGTVPDFDSLNLPVEMKNVIHKRSGLVLVTGLTGDGKSTTIASLINIINQTQNKHIITIEDPIEYHYPKGSCLITQREVPSDCVSFGDGLRSALRQDPDIIVIGEMRDKETIDVTLEAAESGHLVFSTLHTASAAASVDRIISYYSDEEQNNVRAKLSSVLTAVFSQKLLPAADGNGRCPAVEVMFSNVPISSLIRDGKIYQMTSYIRMNKQNDMICMDDALVKLVLQGKITREEALRCANEPQVLINEIMRYEQPEKKKKR